MKSIDTVDRRILKILQENARTPNVEIARRLKLAPSAILERIRKLEKRGAIRGYEAQLDAPMLDVGLVAFIFVRADERVGSTAIGEALARVPGVQEVHHVAGEDCYLVKLRAAGTEALGKLLRERFGAIRGITSTRTTVVFTTVKETAKIPLDEQDRTQESGIRNQTRKESAVRNQAQE
ncbi:MAG TPA: Lrp/AsnC family transcriptional regulator [Planctomycetota bacterium]|nr:Lrp/AsnC family transcriptional regulator [Planctomycetota bacterium]